MAEIGVKLSVSLKNQCALTQILKHRTFCINQTLCVAEILKVHHHRPQAVPQRRNLNLHLSLKSQNIQQNKLRNAEKSLQREITTISQEQQNQQQKMILKELIKNSPLNSILIKTMLHKQMKHLRKQLQLTLVSQTQKRKDIMTRQERNQAITSLGKTLVVGLDSSILNRTLTLMKFSICSLEVAYSSHTNIEGDNNKHQDSNMTHTLVEQDNPAMAGRRRTRLLVYCSNNLLHSYL